MNEKKERKIRTRESDSVACTTMKAKVVGKKIYHDFLRFFSYGR